MSRLAVGLAPQFVNISYSLISQVQVVYYGRMDVWKPQISGQE